MYHHTYLKRLIGDEYAWVVYQQVGVRNQPSDCVWIVPGSWEE